MRKRWIILTIVLLIAIVCIAVHAAETMRTIRNFGRVAYEITRLIRIAATQPS